MKQIKIGHYENEDEEDVIKSIFQKSGIGCVKRVPVKIPDADTDIDVLGICENVMILVECVGKAGIGLKSRRAKSDFDSIEPALDRVIAALPADHEAIALYETFKQIDPAKRIFKRLLVSLNHETQNDVKDNHIISFLSSCNFFLWTFEEMYYFRTIADCTFDHCRFEILEYLNVPPTRIISENTEPSAQNYVAYGKRYPEYDILNFVVPVKILLRRSSVKRLQDSSSKAGYQRLLDREKLKRMREYLLQDFPVYPNNIICTLHDAARVGKIFELGATMSLGRALAPRTTIQNQMEENLFLVELPDTHDAFEIIDGQHRLFSFSQTRYAQYEQVENADELEKLKEGDKRIADLSEGANLVVTAIHARESTARIDFSNPGRLFLDINTTQTRIRPEDVIDLVGKFRPDHPKAHANVLLTKLNAHGVLENKIRVKFWQEDRIKRTSLITYSGLQDVFDSEKKNNQSYRIFRKAFTRQTAITDYLDFCFILLNNYLDALSRAVAARRPRQFREMEKDLKLSRYYLFSAVLIGALVRLLRHFISDADEEFHILDNLGSAIVVSKNKDKTVNEEKTVNRNIRNRKIRNLFLGGMRILTDQLDFTKAEFDGMDGWGANKWAKIEADLFYTIRNHNHSGFGDVRLISKKYRRRRRKKQTATS